MTLRAADFRGLHHRRTAYRPGFGVCQCPVCRAAFDASGGRLEGPDYGSPVEGCAYVNREMEFARLWEQEHAPRNGRADLSQELMRRPAKRGEQRDPLWNRGPVAWVLTRRDRIILATIVQWLGSNIGFDFLRRALRECGYDITERRRK